MHVLDNPVWYSLTGPHKKFAQGQRSARRYPTDVAPFVAVDFETSSWRQNLTPLLDEKEESVLVGGDTESLSFCRCTSLNQIDQMVYEGGLPQGENSEIVELGEDMASQMLRLTGEVFPGYFRKNTLRMGRYFGILHSGTLVAMAGQRMRPSETDQELSAICTHPSARGRGYAAQLTSRLILETLKENRRPFLHVNSENTSAINIYSRIGFKKRQVLTVRRLLR